MKKSLLLLSLAATHATFLVCASSENEPPHKKRRVLPTEELILQNSLSNSPQNQPITALEELRRYGDQINRYQALDKNTKISTWSKIFAAYLPHNISEIVANLTNLLPYTNDIDVFNHIMSMLLPLPATTKLAVLKIIRPFLTRFPTAPAIDFIINSLLNDPIFLEEQETILMFLHDRNLSILPENLIFKSNQANLLQALQEEINTTSNPQILLNTLSKLAPCRDTEQVLFIDTNFQKIFGEQITSKTTLCFWLLNYLKSLLSATQNVITCGYIAKIAANIGFANGDIDSQDMVAQIALSIIQNPTKFTADATIKNKILDYLDLSIEYLKTNLFWLRPSKKENQEKVSADLLEYLKTASTLSDHACIKKFSEVQARKIIFRPDTTFCTTEGRQLLRAETIFFSQASKKLCKISPQAQIAYLQELQKRSNEVKKHLLFDSFLWRGIIDDKVGIEFLKTIQSLSEKKQLRCLMQEISDKENTLEGALAKYPTAKKLQSYFFENLMRHISGLSATNAAKIMGSQLFDTVIPHVGQVSTISKLFFEKLKTLQIEEQYEILNNEKLLEKFLGDYVAFPQTVSFIATLPEALQLALLKIMFALRIDAEIGYLRVEKELESHHFCLLLDTIQKMSLPNQIELFYSNPTILYRLIKNSENKITHRATQKLLKNLTKTSSFSTLTHQKQHQVATIFASLITYLIQKPIKTLHPKKYLTYARIPSTLPINYQSNIAETILYNSANLVSENRVPEIYEWIRQHYSLNLVFDFLEKHKNSPQIKQLFTCLRNNQMLDTIKQGIKDFYQPAFIQKGTQTILKKLKISKADPKFVEKQKIQTDLIDYCSKKFDAVDSYLLQQQATIKKPFHP